MKKIVCKKHHWKKLFVLLLFNLMLHTLTMHSMQSLKNSLNYMILTPSLLVLSQLAIAADASTPGDSPWPCYETCIANCPNYIPPLCYLDGATGPLFFALTAVGTALTGGLAGYLTGKFIKEYWDKKVDERSRLINESMDTTDVE